MVLAIVIAIVYVVIGLLVAKAEYECCLCYSIPEVILTVICWPFFLLIILIATIMAFFVQLYMIFEEKCYKVREKRRKNSKK